MICAPDAGPHQRPPLRQIHNFGVLKPVQVNQRGSMSTRVDVWPFQGCPAWQGHCTDGCGNYCTSNLEPDMIHAKVPGLLARRRHAECAPDIITECRCCNLDMILGKDGAGCRCAQWQVAFHDVLLGWG